MITTDNFEKVLEYLRFTKSKDIYSKKFPKFDCELKVDFKNEKLIFPKEKGFTVNNETTTNFSSSENLICQH